MPDTNNFSDTNRGSTNRAYNSARSEWHRQRAALAIDSATRALHEKFATLYQARSTDFTSSAHSTEFKPL